MGNALRSAGSERGRARDAGALAGTGRPLRRAGALAAGGRFVDPRAISSDADAEFLARESENLSLPSEKGSSALILATWKEYSRRENRFLQAKSDYMQRKFNTASKVNLDLIWDGDGRNPNAALTVFRHFNSASVVKGLVGEPPKTAWVISYALLERIHYLLVAGFDGGSHSVLRSRLPGAGGPFRYTTHPPAVLDL